MSELLPFAAEFQCTSTSKQSGHRCRRRAIPGGSVCHIHGGASPQVQAAARARLEKIRLESEVAALLDELELDGNDDPLTTMRDALVRVSRMVTLLGVLVSELAPTPSDGKGKGALFGPDHLGDLRPHPLVSLYKEHLELQARMSKLTIELDLDELFLRREEMAAEVAADELFGVYSAILDGVRRELVSAGVDAGVLDVAWRERVPGIARAALEASPLAGDGDGGL